MTRVTLKTPLFSFTAGSLNVEPPPHPPKLTHIVPQKDTEKKEKFPPVIPHAA